MHTDANRNQCTGHEIAHDGFAMRQQAALTELLEMVTHRQGIKGKTKDEGAGSSEDKRTKDHF